VTRLVTVAHGTRNPAGNDVARELTRVAGAALGMRATAAFVELCEPSLPEVLASSAEPTVVVPLLLSTGHHVRHDLPEALGHATGPVALGAHLGPDVLVARAQVDRLLHGGAVPGETVVMVAAGSRDPGSLQDLYAAAELLADEWGGPVSPATLGGLGPRPEEIVTPETAVSPYLLAEGFFAARLRERCAAAYAVADVIGPHPDLVRLVVERAAALASVRRSA
jgi:sirohydrochlorin ferrochelatase